MKLITETLRAIKHLPIERLHLFNKKGTLIYVEDGNEDECFFVSRNGINPKGKIAVHNHPKCFGNCCKLTDADIEFAVHMKLYKIISICSCGNIDQYKGRY